MAKEYMGRVFHFSGGHSSGMMVKLYWKPGDLVIFCNTTREDEDTYRFINDFEKQNSIPVIQLQMKGGWGAMLKKMNGIPNFFRRRCTLELKILTARRYLRSIGWFRYTQAIGFRYDERDRVEGYFTRWKAVETIFPLFDNKITVDDVEGFWAPNELKLKIPAILKNCDLCFMKGEDSIIAILTNDITKADKWIADEENKILNPKGYTYFKGISMRQLRDTAQILISQGKIYDLNNRTFKFNCACTG